MAPKKKVSREEIIDAAFEIAVDEGIKAISVRKIANKIECSVAPIYVNFENIEDVISALIGKVKSISLEMGLTQYTDNSFLNFGIGSVKFALKYGRLYKDILIENLNTKADENETKKQYEIILEQMHNNEFLKDFNNKELLDILFKMRTFTHGLATLACCGDLPLDFTEEKIIKTLAQAGEDIIYGAKRRKHKDESIIYN